MELSPTIQRFVLHFGEMGSRWGISRTVGQIYALLFLSDTPLNAEEIGQKLGYSRSNVSIGLKELQSWNLVRLKHIVGDRRDYFTTPDDLWAIVRTLAEERKKREIDPTVSLLRDMMLETPISEEEKYAQDRIQKMHELIELLTGWYDDIRGLDNKQLERLLMLGSAVQQVLKFKDKITKFPFSDKNADKDTA